MPKPQIKFPSGPVLETAPQKRRRLAVLLADLLESSPMLLQEVDALMSCKNPSSHLSVEEYCEYDCE